MRVTPVAETLILLPGLLSDQRVWQHQIQVLSKAYSVRLINSQHQDSAAAMVKHILEQAPEKFALAGHSMGGWLALEVMRVAADRVRRLCLVNTTAEPDSAEKRARRIAMIEAVKRGEFASIAQAIADRFVYQASTKPHVLKMFLDIGPEVFIHQQTAMLHRDDTKSVLSMIHCPTLILHAAEDKNFSLAEHQYIAKHIQQAHLVTVQQAGHMSPMEAPQAVAGWMREWMAG